MCPTIPRSVASSCAPVELDVAWDGRRAKVVVVGEVDRCTVPDLVAALTIVCTASRGVEVDLSRATFMDLSGLRALLDLHIRLGRLPEAVVLRDPHPSLRWILDLPGIDLVFAIRFTSVPGTRDGAGARDGAGPAAAVVAADGARPQPVASLGTSS
jgi:anti-anti-sigma factor